jgi:hypothetical protein
VQPKMPADKPEENREASKAEISFDLGSLQFFEDHDTRGDSRYPPVKEPRDVPRSIEEWRRRHNR